MKSLLSIACPVLLFGLLDMAKGDFSFTCTKVVMVCLFYAYFEEYGWRGYLQSELIGFRKWGRVLIIKVLWFMWYLNFECSISNLLFFVILFFGSWGIGQIAIRTQSIVICACFHSVINIMQNVDMTVAVLTLLVLCVVLWFWLWYGKYTAFFKWNCSAIF